LFIIPRIWIGIRLSLSTQALVVEGRRPTEKWGDPGRWWAGRALVARLRHLIVAGLLIGLGHHPSRPRPERHRRRTTEAGLRAGRNLACANHGFAAPTIDARDTLVQLA